MHLDRSCCLQQEAVCLVCSRVVADPALCVSRPGPSSGDACSYPLHANGGSRGHVPTSCAPPPLLHPAALPSPANGAAAGWSGNDWQRELWSGDDSGLELRVLACGHPFHKACLEAWSSRAGLAAVCPWCHQLQMQPRAGGGQVSLYHASHRSPTLLQPLGTLQLEPLSALDPKQDTLCAGCVTGCLPLFRTSALAHASRGSHKSTSGWDHQHSLWNRRQAAAAHRRVLAS